MGMDQQKRSESRNWFDNHCKDPGKREMVMGGGEPRQGREGRIPDERMDICVGRDRWTELTEREKRAAI